MNATDFSTSLRGSRALATSGAAIALVLAVGTFSATASAQPAPQGSQEAAAQDIAQARQLGRQAQTAFDAGNFAESEKLWSAASKLYAQAPTLTLGLARTQAKLGKVVAAQESYNKIVREWSASSNAPQAFKDALEAAKSEVVAVSAKVATVTLSVEGPANPVVTLDGQTVPAAALGLKRPVDPGAHKVTATAEGYKPGDATFLVTEGGNATSVLKLEKSAISQTAPVAAAGAASPATASSAAGSDPSADRGSGGSSNKTLALVAFGVGGAGLVFGTVTGVIALGKASSLKTNCASDKTCPPSEQSNVDSYKSMGTLSTVGFAVAGVGAIAGAVLWFTAPSAKSASAAASSSTQARASLPQARAFVPYFAGTSAGVTGQF